MPVAYLIEIQWQAHQLAHANINVWVTDSSGSENMAQNCWLVDMSLAPVANLWPFGQTLPQLGT